MPPINAPWVLVDAADYNAKHKKSLLNDPTFKHLLHFQRTCEFIEHVAAELAKSQTFVYFAYFPTDNSEDMSGEATGDAWPVPAANAYWNAVIAALTAQHPKISISTLCAATDLVPTVGGQNWSLSDAGSSHFPEVRPAQNRPYMIWLATVGGPLDPSLLCDPSLLKKRWILSAATPPGIVPRGTANDVLSQTKRAFVLGGAIAYQATIALQ